MPTIVLDISRSVSRIGKGRQTGIDRVELAYIEHFINFDGPVFFLARFRRQSAILDQAGMRTLWGRIQNDGPWGNSSAIDRTIRTTPIEKTVRQLAISWPLLEHGLRKTCPSGFTYINVGHGKFKTDLWGKLRRGGARKIIAMVHDVIPLDYPQYCRPDTVAPFRKNLRALVQNVDVLLYNSVDTQTRVQRWLTEWKCDPIEEHVVLLGTNPLPIPAKRSTTHPYFVCLGTIEPRKNHRLLLDIWADFHKTLPLSDIPHLHIVGARGWMNEGVFHDLDTKPFMGVTVHERGQLTDSAVGELLYNARALLFPSFAEGFGYPLIEALQMQVPAICANLACFREIAGDTPTYINTTNQHAWGASILRQSTRSLETPDFTTLFANNYSWSRHLHNINTIVTDNHLIS